MKWTLVLGAVAVIVVSAWAGYRVHQAEPLRDAAISVPAVDAAAPPTEMPQPGLAGARTIPELLPAFTLQDRNGRATPVSTWQGKSLIINFWATWCAPCRREMPLLQALDRDRSAQGFRVIGIAVDRRKAVVAFADALHIDYPLLVGEEDALALASSLGVTSPAFPFTVFTDRRGQIVALYFGELHKPETDLILSAVQQVNRDQLQLPQARQDIADGLAKLRTTTPI